MANEVRESHVVATDDTVMPVLSKVSFRQACARQKQLPCAIQ
jgi:hypothetical protein